MEPHSLPTNLEMTLNNYCKNQRPIRVQCLLADKKIEPPVDGMEDDQLRVKLQSTTEHEEFTHSVFSVLDPNREYEYGRFLSIQHGGDLYLLSGGKAGFFRTKVSRIINNLYPDVVPAFIHSNEMRDILGKHETETNVRLLHKNTAKTDLRNSYQDCRGVGNPQGL